MYNSNNDKLIKDLPDEVKQTITNFALKSAKNRGYCLQTRNVLSDLGLPTESNLNSRKVLVEIEYVIDEGYIFVPSNLQYIDYNSEAGRPVIKILNIPETSG